MLEHGRNPADYQKFETMRPELRRNTTLAAARQGDGRAIIACGLWLLVATPVARVIFAAFGFAIQRDFRYVLVSLIVLSVLLYSIVHGYVDHSG